MGSHGNIGISMIYSLEQQIKVMRTITGCTAQEINNPSPIKRASIISASDQLSRTSASNLFRIQRKPQDRSLSKRSKKSQEEVEEALSLSKFYTKMKAGAIIQHSEVKRESKLVSLDSTKQAKHRSPTPLPGFHRADKGAKANKNQSTVDLELELQIADLQKKVEDERIRKVAAQRRAQIFQKEVREKLKLIQQLEGQLAKTRINQAENTSNGKFSESTSVGSNLQKLKKNMAQFRLHELETQNTEILRQNNQLKLEIDRLKIENQAYRDETEALKNQIFLLSQKAGSAMIQAKQKQIEHLRQRLNIQASQRQMSLDHLLVQSQRSNLSLKNKITQLQLKIAFINRKKNEQIELITSRKDKDLTSMRKKLSLLAKQMLDMKKEVNIQRVRQCALTRTSPRCRKESECSFELSPDT